MQRGGSQAAAVPAAGWGPPSSVATPADIPCESQAPAPPPRQ